MKFILTMFLSLLSFISYADFYSMDIYKGRKIQYSFPEQFNGTVIMMLHGALPPGTTLRGSEVLLTSQPTRQLIDILVSKGYGIVIPDSVPGYGLPFYQTRWDSRNDSQDDLEYLKYIITEGKAMLNKSVTKDRGIKKIFCLGGSNGAMECSNLASESVDLLDGIIMINGCNYKSISIDSSGNLNSNKDITIPWYHPPALIIYSTIDHIITEDVKKDYSKASYNSPASVQYVRIEGGEHNWTDWVVPEYDNILAWLKRQ